VRDVLLGQQNTQVVLQCAVDDVRDGELQRLGRRGALRNTPAERTTGWELTAKRSVLLREQGTGADAERSNDKESDAEVTNHSTVAPQKD